MFNLMEVSQVADQMARDMSPKEQDCSYGQGTTDESTGGGRLARAATGLAAARRAVFSLLDRQDDVRSGVTS